jgi:hypothetical protein
MTSTRLEPPEPWEPPGAGPARICGRATTRDVPCRNLVWEPDVACEMHTTAEENGLAREARLRLSILLVADRRDHALGADVYLPTPHVAQIDVPATSTTPGNNSSTTARTSG